MDTKFGFSLSCHSVFSPINSLLMNLTTNIFPTTTLPLLINESSTTTLAATTTLSDATTTGNENFLSSSRIPQEDPGEIKYVALVGGLVLLPFLLGLIGYSLYEHFRGVERKRIETVRTRSNNVMTTQYGQYIMRFHNLEYRCEQYKHKHFGRPPPTPVLEMANLSNRINTIGNEPPLHKSTTDDDSSDFEKEKVKDSKARPSTSSSVNLNFRRADVSPVVIEAHAPDLQAATHMLFSPALRKPSATDSDGISLC